MTALSVAAVGPLALIEDLGRPGHGSVGVPTGGATDRRALRLANRILGNDEGAPAVEVLLGGLALRAVGRSTVCVAGAPAPLMVAGHPVDAMTPLVLQDGQTLAMGMPRAGLRSYLAVRGGVIAPLLFGSASADPTSGLGPPALQPGDRLEIGPEPTEPIAAVDEVGFVAQPVTDVVLRVVVGPRNDWLRRAAERTLLESPWTVTPEGDRVGVRLSGPVLQRRRQEELPSEPLVRGAIQVPPSGQPIVFLADHPTTGGYPVPAVVVDDDTDILAQLRPGERVRFRAVPLPW